jgi:hypothetical protein
MEIRHHLTRFTLASLLVLAITACRFLPYAVPASHPLQDWLWGFTPLWAVMLFGVAQFSPMWLGWVVPFFAMLISDLILHFTGLAPTTLMGRLLIYSLMMAIGGLGLVVRRRKTVPVIAAAGLGSSLLFFLTSNFLVWLNSATGLESGQGIVYERSLPGLLQCYLMGLPFLRNDILSTGFYSLVLFGGWAMLERRLFSETATAAAEAR